MLNTFFIINSLDLQRYSLLNTFSIINSIVFSSLVELSEKGFK